MDNYGEKKPANRILENIGNEKMSNFESEQNLIGLFTILLETARRTKSEKYLDGYKKEVC